MDDPIAEITDGKLKGTFLETYKGEKFYAFLGIPYGKPPVGELRFKVSDYVCVHCYKMFVDHIK